MSNINKSSILIFSLIGIFGITTGTIAGKIYRNNHAKTIIYNPNDYKDNEEEIFTKYLELKSQNNDNFEQELTPVEILQVGFMLLNDINYCAESIGEVNASIVTQYITSSKIQLDNTFYYESLSISSMVKVASRYYSDISSIKCYDKYTELSKNEQKICHASYKDEFYNMSHEEFADEFGGDIDQPTIYLFSSKTILEGTIPNVMKIDDGYMVEATFGEKAAESYKKQMAATSSMVDSISSFDAVTVQCYFDHELKIQQFTVNEKYTTISKSLPIKCQAKLTTSYYYDDFSIPSYDEKYLLKEERSI